MKKVIYKTRGVGPSLFVVGEKPVFKLRHLLGADLFHDLRPPTDADLNQDTYIQHPPKGR